ncbi:MAG: glycosyl transferase [Hyphomicrobiales bacterium]|nr:glycosyl transferase [Hyphomicrobiales bacterium]
MMVRVFFFVQNLLGIGHVVRAARLARAMCDKGIDVTVASGGVPVEGLDFSPAHVVQLPPLKAGPGGFSDLRLADGTPLDDHHRDLRRGALLAAFASSNADILLIEAFPFGRRGQRFELLPLLAAARQRQNNVLIVSSVRDILQSGRSPARRKEMLDLVHSSFDLVLIHGDGAVTPFDESFPEAADIRDKLAYTGLVGPEAVPLEGIPIHDVIVAAGGGSVGGALLETAIAARAMSCLKDARWLVVAGPYLPGDVFARLDASCRTQNIDLVRFVGDLPQRYARAQLVISQAGYNTVADVLTAGCRSLLVPFTAAGESEQNERAQSLARRGLASLLDPEKLTSAALADVIDKTMRQPHGAQRIVLNGAARTAEILLEALVAQRARPR